MAYLSAMISSTSRVVGSSQRSRCLRRVPSLHPAVKYSMACTSCTPSQELRSSAQRVRQSRVDSLGPWTHKESWRGLGGRLYVLVKLRMTTSVKSSQLLML